MSVVARFDADFAKFNTAVRDAEKQLVDFSSRAGKVETALSRMTESFSGKKLIQEAALMTRAIEDAGGIATLTGNQLQHAGAKAAEAAEKMKKLGIDVPPGLQRVADAAKQADVATDKWSAGLSQANRVLGALGIGLSVGAVVQFGRSVLEAGDQIQKMADQTGLSISEVQKLQYVAGQSGTSIGSLVGAVQNLQQRLGDENSGAAGAMAKLGINAEAFNKLSTYQQMTSLSDAVRGIKDPTEQASTAAALFGKSWKEILPAIKAGMKEVGDQAPIMADETVKSLDRVGDALKRSQAQATTWGGGLILAIEGAGFAFGDFLSRFNLEHFGVATSQILKMAGALNDPTGITKAIEKAVPPAKVLGESLRDLSLTAGKTSLAEKELTASAEALILKNREAAVATKKANDEYKSTLDTIHKLSSGWVGVVAAVGGVVNQDLEVTKATIALNKALDDVQRTTHVANFGFKGLSDGLENVGIRINDLGPDIIHQFVGPQQEGIRASKDLGKEALATSQKLSNGFGDVANILNNIPGKFGEIGSMAARTGQAIIANLGNPLGMIAAIATGATGIITKLFGGVSQAEKDARKNIQDFEAQLASSLTATQKLEAGGKSWAMTTIAVRDAYRAAGLSAADAEVAVVKLWGSSKLGADAAKKAIDEINAVLNDQKKDAADLEAAVARYGFTIEQLGPAMKRQKLDEQAQQLLNDWRLLVGAGFDVTVVNQQMATSVQDYLNMALKTGIEVPIAMKPILQSMIDQGQLFDENGVAITDLGQTGVTFSETMTQGFDKIVKKLQELLEKIGMVPAAINAIPTSRDIDVNVRYNDPGFDPGGRDVSFASRGGLVTPAGVVQYLAGGSSNVLPFLPRGTDTVPAMLTPGERVLSVAQNKAFEAGGGGGFSTAALEQKIEANTAEMQLLRRDLARDRQMLPKLIVSAQQRQVS